MCEPHITGFTHMCEPQYAGFHLVREPQIALRYRVCEPLFAGPVPLFKPQLNASLMMQLEWDNQYCSSKVLYML